MRCKGLILPGLRMKICKSGLIFQKKINTRLICNPLIGHMKITLKTNIELNVSKEPSVISNRTTRALPATSR